MSSRAPVDLSWVPELEGWITLSEAGLRLGKSRWAMHKMAAARIRDPSGELVPRHLLTVRRVGEKPFYIVRAAEIAAIRQQLEAGVPEDQLAAPGLADEGPGGEHLQ